ncbi:hypothetical protein DMA11_22640 [Marinilabiliaceae bacterium JC017]|nr:hypothetical protein DMA11_22640 [Marinilabiliaceae bacterium JC017]
MKKYWPILVSASKKIGYSTIIYPDFLEESKNFIIAKSLKRKAKDDNYYFKTINIGINKYFVLYKTDIGKSYFLTKNSSDNDILMDEFGRPLYLSWGIISPDFEIINSVDNEMLLDLFHNKVLPHYNDFYNSKTFYHAFKINSEILNEKRPSDIKYKEEDEIDFFVETSSTAKTKSDFNKVVQKPKIEEKENPKKKSKTSRTVLIILVIVIFAVVLIMKKIGT